MTLDFENQAQAAFPFDPQKTAETVIEECLNVLGCPYEAEVSLSVTDGPSIRDLNRRLRGIDSETDVLSFPMADYPSPGSFEWLEDESADLYFSPENGELQLGDIVINAARVFSQAEEYGHSPLREYAFLVTHSMLHLTGYDHMTEEEAAQMESLQEQILEKVGIPRFL